MRDQTPETETMSLKISEVKSHLSRLVNAVYRQEKRIIVEKSGIPVAAVVSMEDLRRLRQLDEQRAERWRNEGRAGSGSEKRVIRATLDVNVLASGFPAIRGVPVDLIARWANQEYEMVLSEHILAGLQRT